MRRTNDTTYRNRNRSAHARTHSFTKRQRKRAPSSRRLPQSPMLPCANDHYYSVHYLMQGSIRISNGTRRRHYWIHDSQRVAADRSMPASRSSQPMFIQRVPGRGRCTGWCLWQKPRRWTRSRHPCPCRKRALQRAHVCARRQLPQLQRAAVERG